MAKIKKELLAKVSADIMLMSSKQKINSYLTKVCCNEGIRLDDLKTACSKILSEYNKQSISLAHAEFLYEKTGDTWLNVAVGKTVSPYSKARLFNCKVDEVQFMYDKLTAVLKENKYIK